MDHAVAKASTCTFTTCSSSVLINSFSTHEDNDLEDHLFSELVAGCHTKPKLAHKIIKEIKMAQENTAKEENPQQAEEDEFCKIKMDSLYKLKDSTKKLLYIIEEIQSKTHASKPIPNDFSFKLPILNANPSNITDFPDSQSLKKLENQTKNIEAIQVEDVDDDCSVFKRLSRKCNCLNRKEYNDFVIHFNEDTKYITSDVGEIIKNTRILKKFLYMGDGYTKNALMFLNEGLTKSSHSEKVEMILACSHADICNVFDDDSFVVVFISWPTKFEDFGDQVTQSLAARVLYRLAVIEEGRRYLNFNSKISNDIKKLLRQKAAELDGDTLEFLNSTLNLLSPSIAPHVNATYYCKADEGMTNKLLNELLHFRTYMTLHEVTMNLDLINKLSDTEKGRAQLKLKLPILLSLFKLLLIEYDNSEINVMITSISNNLMTAPKNTRNDLKTYYVTDIATEPIPVKDANHQMPSKIMFKKVVKSRLSCGQNNRKCNKSNQLIRRQDSGEPPRMVNKSEKSVTKYFKNSMVIRPNGKLNTKVR